MTYFKTTFYTLIIYIILEIIQNKQVNKEVEVIDISGDIDDPPIIWERFPDYVIDINDPAINWEYYPIAEIPLQKRVIPPFMIHPPEYSRVFETFRKLCKKNFSNVCVPM
ncbi:uncharacterized protein LOC116851679 [Odontomachus brunneus]|uniref:uncharacterized protein LOC116851679 n=1 Tax=Odontomachus brunneus TaxID=486640 RepID=UPI0013F1C7C6|nr:uncharacterized protein LOC116851679 [Odontomachus brunneus]